MCSVDSMPFDLLLRYFFFRGSDVDVKFAVGLRHSFAFNCAHACAAMLSVLSRAFVMSTVVCLLTPCVRLSIAGVPRRLRRVKFAQLS